MKDGLIFLNNTFHIFYFKEFPDLIFGEPQLLLNLMTDIVVRHIKLTPILENKVYLQFGRFLRSMQLLPSLY